MQPNTGRKFQIREMLGGWEGKAPTGAFAADRFVSAKGGIPTVRRAVSNGAEANGGVRDRQISRR
jgi:hypothetical protein